MAPNVKNMCIGTPSVSFTVTFVILRIRGRIQYGGKYVTGNGLGILYTYYPLAQQSCGGDIGSVPYVCMYVRTYVRTFVRSFVCSPALATSFIIRFRYNFTQVLDMTIPRTSSRFSVIGSRSRSQ